MIPASDNEKASSKSLTYDEDWLDFLEPDLCKDASSVDSFAHLLFNIKDALPKGPEGVKAAGDALLDGIKMAYLYTDEHQAALELYLIYLTGNLKPPDEPLELLRRAIDRGKAEIERASAVAPKKKRRSGHRKRKRR